MTKKKSYAALIAVMAILILGYLNIRGAISNKWQYLTSVGATALHQGDEDSARMYFAQALHEAEGESGTPNEDELITSLQNLGLCYEQSGRYDRAAKLYSRMTMVTASKYGADSPEMHDAIDVLKRVSKKSPLLQTCPQFAPKKGLQTREVSI